MWTQSNDSPIRCEDCKPTLDVGRCRAESRACGRIGKCLESRVVESRRPAVEALSDPADYQWRLVGQTQCLMFSPVGGFAGISAMVSRLTVGCGCAHISCHIHRSLYPTYLGHLSDEYYFFVLQIVCGLVCVGGTEY